MEWRDLVVLENTKLPFIWLFFSLITAFICEYMIINCLFLPASMMSFTEKSVVLLGFIYILYLLYGGLGLIFEGKSIVRKILSNNSYIKVENALHYIQNIPNSDICSIDDVEKKWRIFKPHFYKMDKKGLTINLNDGRFFRVSPHMERIDELKVELERIIAENKRVAE